MRTSLCAAPNPPKTLPDGWRLVRLGEVCEIIAGQSPPSATYRRNPEGLPFFQGKADFGSLHPVTTTWCTAPTKIAEPGDVLISIRAPVGPTNVADVRCCIGRGLAAIRSTGISDTGFMLWVLRFHEPYLASRGSGSTFSAINRGDLEALEIPFPPLSEQKRISALLSEQMQAIERARATTEAQLEAAKVLPAAYLRAVFNSPEAQSWPKKRIGDVAKVQSGYAFKSEWFASGGIRLLRNANVFQGFIAWDDVARLSFERRSEFKPFELSVGDIILSLDRPVVKGGLKVARLSEQDVPSLLLQRVGRFQLRHGINPDYLFAFLKSAKFISVITGHDQSLGVPHVSPKQVEDVEFPCPSPSDQCRIALQLSAQMASMERLRQMLDEQLDAINKLPTALLRRTFNGEF